jgi:sulfite reductase (ferredoxin)
MLSFINEIDDPIVQKDILDLNRRILLFREGKLNEDSFRSLRLARGVYGQRQPGVQMIRIKVPMGLLTFDQFGAILDVSDRFSTGKYHLTTRQDVQIHHVKLEDSPELWAQLEASDVTLREACGNTVRNVTASPLAGLDPREPFNVLPWADALWRFFLRNPVCQEMGRKFKVAFSSSEEDTGLAVMHDLGVLPAVNDQGERGFKLLVAGGLGAQPAPAEVLHEWVATDELIPITEAILRVFDREGERAKRQKARFKFLYQSLGREALLEAIERERKMPSGTFPEVDFEEHVPLDPPSVHEVPAPAGHQDWRNANVLPQKQPGRFAVGIRVPLGDETTSRTRALLSALAPFTSSRLRITQSQDLLLPDVVEANLPIVHQILVEQGWGQLGFQAAVDVTSCPGTDTCNLAISNSTHLSTVLEDLLEEEFPHMTYDREFSIKISGCMNACGQHSLASFGLHGSSLRREGAVMPAMQILVGGGKRANGEWSFAKKIMKLPTKNVPDALRTVLIDFEQHQLPLETFADYFLRVGDRYHYDLLQPHVDGEAPDLFLDWGSDSPFQPEIGVGECAGVVIDLVSTLLLEAREKLDLGKEALDKTRWGHAIYHAYAAQIAGAKALLVRDGHKTNTYADILASFDEEFVARGAFELQAGSFTAQVLSYLGGENSQHFATSYFDAASSFLDALDAEARSTSSKAS